MATVEDFKYDTSIPNQEAVQLPGVSRKTIFRETIAESIDRLVRVAKEQVMSYPEEDRQMAILSLFAELSVELPDPNDQEREALAVDGIVVAGPDLN